MRGLLGFLIFSALLIGVMVLVVVPVVAGPLIGSYLQGAGIVQGNGVTVDTQGSGAELVTGRVAALRVRGTDVNVQGVIVGDLDVTLHGVSLGPRTFDSLEGRLHNVRVRIPGGPQITIDSVGVTGPSATVTAVGHLAADQAAIVIRDAAARAGVRLDTVILRQGSVQVAQGSVAASASLAVKDGVLVLVPGRALPTVELLRPAPDSGWTLRAVTVGPDGIDLAGTIDAGRLATAAGVLVP